ncbi:MAG: cobalamin-dependent protein, partial [Fibrobacteres bacterium]|nr:cobalamin-dependent protein [Fibrobacterota bacterium]
NNFRVVDLGVMVPAQDIIDAAIREKADAVGLSGLITPSLDEMIHVASEMKRQSLNIPLMVGGATTSKRHTAVRIAPAAGNAVVHVADASLAVPVCQKLISVTQRELYVAAIKDEYEAIKRDFEENSSSVKTISYAEAKRRRLVTDWKKSEIVKPSKTGVTVFRDYSIKELRGYINWSFVLKAWEMDGKSGVETDKLIKDANKLLDIIEGDKLLKAHGVIGLFRASANDDGDIDLFDGPDKLGTVHCLRQQQDRGEGKPSLSLSDYVAPAGSGVDDYAGMFAVTAGIGLDDLVRSYEKKKDDYSAIMVKVLADRLAEAFAERLHQIVRTDLWGYSRHEKLTLDEMFRVKYRGIRPAPGYPACPDHSEKKVIFNILDVEKNCGMALTENFMMLPVASVSGYYFAHPESVYFAVSGVSDEQRADYEIRKRRG